MQNVCAWGVCMCVCVPAELWRFWIHSARASRGRWRHRAVTRARPLPATVWIGWECHNTESRQLQRVETAPKSPHKSFKPAVNAGIFNFMSLLCITGRGFNNLSQVNMARHIPSGQLVAVKQTNLDECTEEELLQLMVSCCPSSLSHWKSWFPSGFVHVWLCLKPQNEVLLSRLFRHPNLLTSRLVFSSCCQLWVLTPLMAYGQSPPNLSDFLFGLVWSLNSN